ncbi:hypothetical protein [Spongiibacter taiwanensis]|nr:hypothetical protein [Spongiibacter taiwanensis]
MKYILMVLVAWLVVGYFLAPIKSDARPNSLVLADWSTTEER